MSIEATEAMWLERVRAWRTSGTSAREFAAQGGYAANTLYRWAQRVDRAPKGFAQLVPRAARPELAPASSEVLIEIGDARIHVAGEVDAGLLSRVVRAVREASR